MHDYTGHSACVALMEVLMRSMKMGAHGLGVMNLNRKLFIDLLAKHKLVVANVTIFPPFFAGNMDIFIQSYKKKRTKIKQGKAFYFRFGEQQICSEIKLPKLA